MTNSALDSTIYKMPRSALFTITEGTDAGKKITLDLIKNYTIGRSVECDIVLSDEDNRVSRQHAMLDCSQDNIFIKDLDSSNGMLVNGVPAKEAALNSGDNFQIGSNVFVLELQAPFKAAAPGEKKNSSTPSKTKKSGPGKRVLLLSLVLLVAVGILGIALMQNNKKEPAKATPISEKTQPKHSTEIQKPVTPQPSEPTSASKAPSKSASESVSPSPAHTAEQAPAVITNTPKNDTLSSAEDHIRQGNFFYSTGKLKHAVEEFEKAYSAAPDNELARKWLLRAESELDAAIDKQYRRALTAQRYMRWEEARNAFRQVLKWSRNKNDERYVNAQKQLKEMEGK